MTDPDTIHTDPTPESPEPAPPEQGATGSESTPVERPKPVHSVQAQAAMGITAGVMGLSGFTAACLVGLASQVPGPTVLLRAIGALFVCWIIGGLIGRAMRVVIEEHLGDHRQRHPRPTKPIELQTPAERHRSAA